MENLNVKEHTNSNLLERQTVLLQKYAQDLENMRLDLQDLDCINMKIAHFLMSQY